MKNHKSQFVMIYYSSTQMMMLISSSLSSPRGRFSRNQASTRTSGYTSGQRYGRYTGAASQSSSNSNLKGLKALAVGTGILTYIFKKLLSNISFSCSSSRKVGSPWCSIPLNNCVRINLNLLIAFV